MRLTLTSLRRNLGWLLSLALLLSMALRGTRWADARCNHAGLRSNDRKRPREAGHARPATAERLRMAGMETRP